MRRIRQPLTVAQHLPAPGAISVTLIAAALACWLTMGGTQASAMRRIGAAGFEPATSRV
jgi:hypothetical protein